MSEQNNPSPNDANVDDIEARAREFLSLLEQIEDNDKHVVFSFPANLRVFLPMFTVVILAVATPQQSHTPHILVLGRRDEAERMAAQGADVTILSQLEGFNTHEIGVWATLTVAGLPIR